MIKTTDIQQNQGNGIFVQNGSSAEIDQCLISFNSDAGLRVHHTHSEAVVSNSQIHNNTRGIVEQLDAMVECGENTEVHSNSSFNFLGNVLCGQ